MGLIRLGSQPAVSEGTNSGNLAFSWRVDFKQTRCRLEQIPSWLLQYDAGWVNSTFTDTIPPTAGTVQVRGVNLKGYVVRRQ